MGWLNGGLPQFHHGFNQGRRYNFNTRPLPTMCLLQCYGSFITGDHTCIISMPFGPCNYRSTETPNVSRKIVSANRTRCHQVLSVASSDVGKTPLYHITVVKAVRASILKDRRKWHSLNPKKTSFEQSCKYLPTNLPNTPHPSHTQDTPQNILSIPPDFFSVFHMLHLRMCFLQ